MLGLKYVMAKSKELTSKLELGSVVGTMGSTSNEPRTAATGAVADVCDDGSDHHDENSTMGSHRSPSPTSPRVGPGSSSEGERFLVAHSRCFDEVLTRHRRLVESGEELGEELTRARKRLLEQVESEAFLERHFHDIARVRERMTHIRGLVEKFAEDIEAVEHFLMQQTEEYLAGQNASFVARQEQELERFEAQILNEKEGRTRQLLEARRQVLADAFQNDLRTYQTLVSYQGPVVAQRALSPEPEETLESIDLVVTTDATQLDAFYESEDDVTASSLEQLVLGREEEEETKERDSEDDGENGSHLSEASATLIVRDDDTKTASESHRPQPTKGHAAAQATDRANLKAESPTSP